MFISYLPPVDRSGNSPTPGFAVQKMLPGTVYVTTSPCCLVSLCHSKHAPVAVTMTFSFPGRTQCFDYLQSNQVSTVTGGWQWYVSTCPSSDSSHARRQWFVMACRSLSWTAAAIPLHLATVQSPHVDVGQTWNTVLQCFHVFPPSSSLISRCPHAMRQISLFCFDHKQ